MLKKKRAEARFISGAGKLTYGKVGASGSYTKPTATTTNRNVKDSYDISAAAFSGLVAGAQRNL